MWKAALEAGIFLAINRNAISYFTWIFLMHFNHNKNLCTKLVDWFWPTDILWSTNKKNNNVLTYEINIGSFYSWYPIKGYEHHWSFGLIIVIHQMAYIFTTFLYILNKSQYFSKVKRPEMKLHLDNSSSVHHQLFIL